MTVFAGVAACDGTADRNAPAPLASTRTAATATKVPCKLARLPGTDPAKPVPTQCTKPATRSPAPDVLKAQQAYLDAWKKQAPSWASLSAAQREDKRRKLKESYLGKGVTP